jgi:hypothetical protein
MVPPPKPSSFNALFKNTTALPRTQSRGGYAYVKQLKILISIAKLKMATAASDTTSTKSGQKKELLRFAKSAIVWSTPSENNKSCYLTTEAASAVLSLTIIPKD